MRTIQKLIGTLVIITLICLNACKKDSNANKCNVSDPTEELDWLKTAINDVKHDEDSYYVMATYKKETVFYYGNCNPAINYSSFIQNCSGDNLGNTNELYEELKDITIIWKHSNSNCNFQD